MEKLPKAQEQIMQALWKINKGHLKDIIDALPEPKPHSNTVATLLKILIDKKFVGVKTNGRFHEYHVKVPKADYKDKSITTLIEGYFDGSFSSAVSYMVDSKKLSIKDLELLLKEIKKEKR